MVLLSDTRLDIWTLILAAGASTRFGSIKALAPYCGLTFLEHTLAVAASVTGSQTLVVTGRDHDRLKHLLRSTHFIRNNTCEQGMGNSLSVGTQEIMRRAPATKIIVILLVDQPLVTAAHTEKLILAVQSSARCALTSNGIDTGPPAAIPDSYFELLLEAKGDRGLKTDLRPDDFVTVRDAQQLRDVDTSAQLDQLMRETAS